MTREEAADWRTITHQAQQCRDRGDLEATAEWDRMEDELIEAIGTRDCD